jgi:hypothetical protein
MSQRVVAPGSKMGIKMPIGPNAVIQDGIGFSGRYQASH